VYLVTADEMQRMDRQTIESFGIPGQVLMENAGRGATEVLLENFNGVFHKKVGVIAGRGNNGGDGFVIARYLAQRGIRVTVFLLAERERVAGDARANLDLLSALDVPVVEMPSQEAFETHKTSMRHHNLWVDAILGTGLKSDVRGYFRDVIQFINGLNSPVFAVDIPSGLNSETGQPCGLCVRADVTATFALPKIGHLIYPGATFTGALHVVDIGIPPHIRDSVQPRQHLLTPEAVAGYIGKRSAIAHKGTTGHLLVLSGSPGKSGAAIMTAMSAMRVGAGLVTLATPAGINSIAESQAIEVMTAPLPESADGVVGPEAIDAIKAHLSGKQCLALGPGLGTADETVDLVCRLLREVDVPVVIDADGLNILATDLQLLRSTQVPVILTPHPGEMARLTGGTTRDVQSDRIRCARDFAQAYDVHLVLKGARTVIAHPDGSVYVNPTGNPGMASGGMGDVLTGLIAGLVTQGLSPETAARSGVYLHGRAADKLANSNGPIGFLATDVMNGVPGAIRDLESFGDSISISHRFITRAGG